MLTCEPTANLDHVVYGSGLQIYVGDYLQQRYLVFKTQTPYTYRGENPLLPVQIELTQTLKGYVSEQGRDNFDTGSMAGDSTLHYTAKGKMNPTRHEEAAQALLDVAHKHHLIDEKIKNTGLGRMRFVHEVRYDKAYPKDTSPFQGMRTDTKDSYPIDIYFDESAGDRPLSELFSRVTKSKLFSWGIGCNVPLHASFSLVRGASLKDAARELLIAMKDARIQTGENSKPFMRPDQYTQSNEALLLGL